LREPTATVAQDIDVRRLAKQRDAREVDVLGEQGEPDDRVCAP
jgi:hypothetical protein